MLIRDEVSHKPKTGILIVNTGSPSSPDPESVKDYLAQFLSHPRIVPMPKIPWSIILNTFILPKRKDESAYKYAQIWTKEGSPLVAIQERLAVCLEDVLSDAGYSVSVKSAMSFGRPSIGDALAELELEECGNIVVLPLYPQGAFSTTKVVEDALADEARRFPLAADAEFVDGYSEEDAYMDAIAESIRKSGFSAAPGERLMLSFHSVPMADIEAGDTYDKQVYATVKGIEERLGVDEGFVDVGFQSRFDKERTWLSPFSAPVLKSLMDDESCTHLYMICPNFAIDCLETLYDVEKVAGPAFRAQKGSEDSFTYVKCLNDSAAHVKVLAKVLEPYL